MKGNVIGYCEYEARWAGYSKRIAEMATGEYGWTMPWAYDRRTNQLDDRFFISPLPGGLATVLVECVEPGRYRLIECGK